MARGGGVHDGRDAAAETNYPSWCLALVIGLTLISLLSHAAPSHWIPAPGLPLRKSSSVLADASNADPLPSPHKWVAPSPLPQKGVMDEVFDSVHGDGGCMKAPESWGHASRVVLPDAVMTDPPLIVYHDVLRASDPVCARITHARHDGEGPGSAKGHWEEGDDDRIVWTTHLNKGRWNRLVDLEARWGGCISIALWICDAADWTFVKHEYETTAGVAAHVTIHAVLGHGAYPYNTMRNVALAPFAPWAAGRGRPEPWVFVADADGIPSVGEARFSELIKATVEGRANAPELLDELPPSLAFLEAHEYGLSKPALHPKGTVRSPPVLDASDPTCAEWDGRPKPMQCQRMGHPSGLGWAERDWVHSWHKKRSRCPRPVSAKSTFFVVPSFDTRRDNAWLIGKLLSIPGDSPLSHAFAYLRSMLNAGAIEVQAQDGYPPSYVAMVPWGTWTSDDPAGAFPVHYSFIYEPYFIAKSPLPSTSLDTWAPFDEYYREPGYDKCIFFVETAGLPRDHPRHYDLELLPQVYLLNAQGPGSGGPKPSRHINWERFMNAREKNDIHCQDMCPCVPAANQSIPPPQGFWDNVGANDRAGSLRGLTGAAVMADPREQDAEIDATGQRKEPSAYVRWRLERDRAREYEARRASEAATAA